ncbi:MAG TPA: SOS response-associated peptidase [Casimicrobiaceae bacterium]|nr:SOS response-associated peptidase [Casimicrobiaceae bacterium]
MCGRYELHTHPAAIALAFGVAHAPHFAPRYNIAPTDDIPIVRINSHGERELARMRWGLVPRWAKDPSIGTRMINARSETIVMKPAYRNAFHRHRCLVPADAFYEWKATPRGKQPMRIALASGEPFGMAGLYERWLSPEGEVLDTCTILTTASNELLRPLHDRMPVIVPPEHYQRWLDTSNTDLDDLFAPYPSDAMQAYPVSRRVNAVQNDDASLIERIEESHVSASDHSEGDEPSRQEPPRQPVQDELF